MSSLERPLILHSPGFQDRPKTSVFRRPTHLFKPAQKWACKPCGLILGSSHLILGSLLLIFDVATNFITETAFAITASICFINSGIVGLIAARRFDKGTITLFLIFSLLSAGLCLVLVVESISAINHLCNIQLQCSSHASAVRSVLLVVSLLELVICITTCFVSIRSLCNQYSGVDLQAPKSPYHVLIYGDLVPPTGIRRIVQDVGPVSPNSSNRLLQEYLVEED